MYRHMIVREGFQEDNSNTWHKIVYLQLEKWLSGKEHQMFFAEDQRLISITHMVDHRHPNSSSEGFNVNK